MANNPYSLIHQGGGVKYKFYDDRGHITPNFEYNEGIRPAGQFMPAPYLPAVRFNVYFEEFVVLSGGKVVAFDSAGFVVPAGLRKEAAAYKADFDVNGEASADALMTILYTQDDVKRGVLNAAGVAAVAGEPVVKSFFDIAGGAPLAQNVTVSNPVGLSSYNYWAHPGGNGENPAQYNIQNFNLQNKVAFVTDYVVQVPAVVDKATYDAAPYAGMGALVAADVKPGMFVSFDTDSNFSVLGYEVGSTDAGEVIGQVLEVDTNFPKDLLNQVRTRYTEFGELEKMPGSATEGKPDSMTYSGGYGLVTINLINR
jgi:hypothetical protein